MSKLLYTMKRNTEIRRQIEETIRIAKEKRELNKKPRIIVPYTSDNKEMERKYRTYKQRAIKKGFSGEFELSLDQFSILINGTCVYCGLPSNTIDRKDSLLNYTISNSVSCCNKCNKMKNAYSIEDFISHISTILSYYNK